MVRPHANSTVAASLSLLSSWPYADRDGNGHIEARELSSVMRRLGLKASTEGTTQMMDAADVDGNGQVSCCPALPLKEPAVLTATRVATAPSAPITSPPPSSPAPCPPPHSQIEFPEFVLIMGKRVLEEDGRVELECAFRLLAQQGSGLVKVEDVKALLTTAGQAHRYSARQRPATLPSSLTPDVLHHSRSRRRRPRRSTRRCRT